jgi:hypothetical protein
MNRVSYRVFENGVLRRISVPKRDKVVGGWRRLYNEQLHGCTLHQILLRMRWTGHVAYMGEMTCTKFWFGSPEEKRAFIRPRHIQTDDIKMDVKEIG